MKIDSEVPLQSIRKQLLKKLLVRGSLKAFCAKHKLSYNYVYRVAKGTIVSISHNKAIEINNALNHE